MNQTRTCQFVAVCALGAASVVRPCSASQPQATQPQSQPAPEDTSKAGADPSAKPPMSMTADLRTRFVPGMQARYRWTFDNVDIVALGTGPGMERSRRIEMNLLLRVPEQPSPDHDVELVYESMKTVAKMQSGVLEFDSAAPPEKDAENPVAGGYRPLIGLVLKIKLDQQGQITALTGGEALLQGSPRTRQPRLLFLEKESVQRTFGTLFSSGRNELQTPLAARWTSTDKYAFSQSQIVHMVNTHVLRAIEPTSATIEIRGTVQPENNPPDAAAANHKREGQATGSVIWNTKVGLLHRSEIEHRVKLDLANTSVSVTNSAVVKSVLERVE